MMKSWSAIVGLIALLFAIVYYALQPSGAVAITVTNSVRTNGGYIVQGNLRNLGRKPTLLQATNGIPEILINVQTASNMYSALGLPSGTFSRKLEGQEQVAFEAFVPTNAPAVLFTHFRARSSFKKNVRRAVIKIMTGGRVNPLDMEVASRHVTPP
jgi:hypothetical protein